MKVLSTEKTRKIKDWFSIQGVRLASFVKEHKYTSTLIVTLVFAGVIGIIIYAAGSSDIKAENIAVKQGSVDNPSNEVYSFSTATYTLEYLLSSVNDNPVESGNVEIEAIVEDAIDVKWNIVDGATVVDDNPRHIKIIRGVTNVPAEATTSTNTTLTLNIGNVRQDTKIHYKFIVQGTEITSSDTCGEGDTNCFLSTKVLNTKEESLRLKVVGGKPYSIQTDTQNKYIPFGIVAGIDDSLYAEIVNNEKGLEGYYFNGSITGINLEATRLGWPGMSSPTPVATESNLYGNLLKDGEFLGSYFSRDDVKTFLSKDGVPNNGTLAYQNIPATVECNDKEISAIKSLGLDGIDYIILNVGYEFKDPAKDYITKIIKSGEETNIKDTVLPSGATGLTFNEGGVYTVTYEVVNKTGSEVNQKITRTRVFNIIPKVGNIPEDEYYFNYNESSNDTYFKNKVQACFADANCGIYKTTFTIGENYSLTYDSNYINSEITCADGEENCLGKLEENANYIIIHYNNKADNSKIYETYYFNKKIDLVKSISIAKQSNMCVFKYNNEVVNTTNETLENGITNHTYSPDSNIIINFYTKQIEASEAWNINNVKVSIPTVIDNGKVLPSTSNEDMLTITSGEQTDEKIIPVAAYYVTVKTAKIMGALTPEAPTAVNISLHLTEGEHFDIDTVVYDVQEKVEANLEIKDENDERLLYTSTNNEFDDKSKTLARGDSVKLNYSLNYTADEDVTKSNVTFKVILNEENYNYKLTGDNFVNLPEGSAIKYYINGEESPVTNIEDAKGKRVNYIEITISTLQTNTQLTYSAFAEIDVSSVELITTKFAYDLSSEDKVLNGAIKVTAFKARTDIYIIGSDGYPTNSDITVQAEDTNMSTMSIYPYVESKAYSTTKLNTSLSGKVNVTVMVEIPQKVTYVSNKDYITPTTMSESEDGKTILTYTFNDKNLNETIDSITFDFSYDINIENNTQLEFKSTIEATDARYPNISDTSSVEERTKIRTITYLLGENVIARVSSNKSSIMSNDEFVITANLYNGTTTSKTGSLVINMPTSGYTGNYTLSGVENAFCTTDILVSDSVTWHSCDEYASINYLGVTALKINYDMDSKTTQVNSFTVRTNGNKSGDKYEFEPVIYQDAEENSGVSLRKIIVTVTSLRISGNVWEDFNEDGIMTSDENKIKDVKINLYNADNNALITYAMSDENGDYSFTDLTRGTYYLTAEFDTERYYFGSASIETTNRSLTSSFKNVDNVIRTENIVADGTILNLSNYNLALVSKKLYKVSMDKTITKLEITNALGITSTKDMGNTKLAKLDIRDMNSNKIKVFYNIEVVNSGSYPGYIYRIKDYIPAGMTFNPEYAENKGWYKASDEYIEYQELYNTNTLLEPGVKHNISLVLDISTNEAGSFLNYSIIEEDDLKIFGGKNDE